MWLATGPALRPSPRRFLPPCALLLASLPVAASLHFAKTDAPFFLRAGVGHTCKPAHPPRLWRVIVQEAPRAIPCVATSGPRRDNLPCRTAALPHPHTTLIPRQYCNETLLPRHKSWHPHIWPDIPLLVVRQRRVARSLAHHACAWTGAGECYWQCIYPRSPVLPTHYQLTRLSPPRPCSPLPYNECPQCSAIL